MVDWSLAVDVGGTFTDVVLLDRDSGGIVADKTLTTPAAPLDGVRTGIGNVLARAGVAPADIRRPLVHATTLVTNALVERRTARAALVTTAGFGDTLLIRDEHRYDMYDLQLEFPAPPIPRELAFELEERTRADGTVTRIPGEEALDALADRLRRADVAAVGICLLHSYANPTNEQRAAATLRARLGLPVCLSSEVAPQIREYPRMVTTACNAVTVPIIGPYLAELRSWLSAAGFQVEVLMMLSNGGVVSAQDAARVPIRLVESGPAAGALAGAWFGRRTGQRRVLCFDMGGTTAKSCLVEDGEPTLSASFEIARVYRFKKGSGLPVAVPSVDLVEIGAGGGSLARVDGLGLLKVGPRSAGAEPGPACYGRGGTDPAVTDADLLLGRLDPAFFLGGRFPLDAGAAEQAMGKIAVLLGVPTAEAAAGVAEVVDQSMAGAARMHAVERGVDLRGVTVLAFGGAGPLHACAVAELLEAPTVVFPPNASVLSAVGTLVSPVRIDLARSLPRTVDGLDAGERDALLAGMRAQARQVLVDAGVPATDVRFRYGLDLRYKGQGHEVTLWVGEGETFPVDRAEILRRFDAEYRRLFVLSVPGVPVEVVTWRLSGIADAPQPPVPAVPARRAEPGAPGAPRPHTHRQVRVGRPASVAAVPVYRRSELIAGDRVDGPALVEEPDTTAVLRPGWHAVLHPDGTLVARRGQPR